MYRPCIYLSLALIIAGVLTGCPNSPSPAPTATLAVSQKSITAGQGVTLTWTSANATSVVSTNFGAKAVSGTVTLFPTTTTNYKLVVSGAGGQATATAALTVNTVAPPSAVSGFSTAAYTPGTGFQVQITVTPAGSTVCYAVQDAPPAGWTVTPSSINNSGAFDSVNNMVKWGPFYSTTPIVLSYTVVPPSTASGSSSFSGTASFDGTNVAIAGDRSLLAFHSITTK